MEVADSDEEGTTIAFESDKVDPTLGPNTAPRNACPGVTDLAIPVAKIKVYNVINRHC